MRDPEVTSITQSYRGTLSALDARMLQSSRVTAKRDIVGVSDLDDLLVKLGEIVATCDKEALDGVVPGPLAERLRRTFDEFVHAFDRLTRGTRYTDAIGLRVQAALLPLLRRANNGYRWYTKPRGYAGDYLTIARMYEDVAQGNDVVR